MKLTDIFSIICVLFFACSCSGDEGGINDFSDKNNGSAGEAVLSFQVKSGEVKTKGASDTGSDNTIGQAIRSCSVILFSGNEILAIEDDAPVTDGAVEGVSFMTKVKEGLKVMVVANSKTAFKACKNMDEVRATLQQETDFDADRLVKVGEATVAWSATGVNAGFKPASSTTKTTGNTYIQPVVVKQLSACIQLEAFNVIYNTGSKPADVHVVSVELWNANYVTTTGNGEVTGDPAIYKKQVWNLGSAAVPVYKDGQVVPLNQTPSFYSFRNTNTEKPVTLKIGFTVGEKLYEKLYIINRPGEGDFVNTTGTAYVNPNYLYRLTVNMTVTNKNVDCAIVCYTNDWIHEAGDDISGDVNVVK